MHLLSTPLSGQIWFAVLCYLGLLKPTSIDPYASVVNSFVMANLVCILCCQFLCHLPSFPLPDPDKAKLQGLVFACLQVILCESVICILFSTYEVEKWIIVQSRERSCSLFNLGKDILCVLSLCKVKLHIVSRWRNFSIVMANYHPLINKCELVRTGDNRNDCPENISSHILYF